MYGPDIFIVLSQQITEGRRRKKEEEGRKQKEERNSLVWELEHIRDRFS